MKISIKIFLSIFIIIILIGFIAYITLSNYLNTITGNIISNLSINNSKSNNYNSINWTIFIFLSGLTLITSSLMISRSITKPLKKLQEQTKEIGISHLVKKIDFNSNDEIGDLAQQLKSTFNELRKCRKTFLRSEHEKEIINIKLLKKDKELDNLNNIYIKREIKMIELKKQINNLLKELGKNPVY